MKGYWFSKENGLTEYQKRPIKEGDALTASGALVPCSNGLHFSTEPFDALQYAGGHILWQVEGSDDAVPHNTPVDKYCCSRRVHLRSLDATRLLYVFAARQAVKVIDHWECPAVVREYLTDTASGLDRSDIRDRAHTAAAATTNAAAYAATYTTATNAAAYTYNAAKKEFLQQAAKEFNEMVESAFANL
jgi:hypothetical protein